MRNSKRNTHCSTEIAEVWAVDKTKSMVDLRRQPWTSFSNLDVLADFYILRKKRYREGMDNPVMSALLLDRNNAISLFIASLTESTHTIATDFLTMSKTVDCRKYYWFHKYEPDSFWRKTYTVSLSGNAEPIEGLSRIQLLDENLTLPIDEIDTDVARLNVQMIVNGKERLQRCPIMRADCTHINFQPSMWCELLEIP